MRWQMENVRNFARGKVRRPKPLLQAELAAYLLRSNCLRSRQATSDQGIRGRVIVLMAEVGGVAADRRKLVDQPVVDRDGEYGATRASGAKHIASVDDLLQDGAHHVRVMDVRRVAAGTDDRLRPLRRP